MPISIQFVKEFAFATALLSLFNGFLLAQTTIKIDADAELRPISTYLYGRNNSFSSTNPNWTLATQDLIRRRNAGVTFFRAVSNESVIRKIVVH